MTPESFEYHAPKSLSEAVRLVAQFGAEGKVLAGAGPAAILALDAEIHAVSARGGRWIPAREFFVDLLSTALEGGEILTAVRVPALPPRAGDAYLKLRHPASGFAVAGVAARV